MPAHAKALIRGLLLLLVLCVVAVPLADAHGYVNVPQSRAYKCNLSKASRCGPVMYEPQSVEGPKGFPAAGPANGEIMGAGRFPDLDPQEPSWPTNAAKSGLTTFQWYLTAPHRTSQWRYFITKPTWDSTVPLTRDALDLTPFCTIEDHGAVPPSTVTHECVVPEREGYHIVLAVWDIADTGNAFYQGIDMQFA